MAATPYDAGPYDAPATEPLTPARRRRLPRLHLRFGRFGGTLGLLVVAAGLLVIGIGWNGMAGSGGQVNHVSDLRAQLPWLLSGGFLGLGIVVVGAALLVVQAQREDRARLERKLDEVVEALRGSGFAPAADASATVPRQAAPAAPVADGAAELVVAGAASYHRFECRLVGGRAEVLHLTPAQAAGRGLVACRVCKPAAGVTAAG